MKPEPTDEDEAARSRTLFEQHWLGPLCLLFWVIVIMAAFHGCAMGAECRIAWNPAPESNVVKWRVFRGTMQLAEVTTNAATLDLPTDADSTIAVHAVNTSGLMSAPATMTVIPAIPQDSGLLTTWQSRRPFFYQSDGSGKHFFRFALPTKNTILP